MENKVKTAKQMERHFKGAANHWRLSIILLIEKQDGLSVEAIADDLKANFKTISQHLRYLTQSGLITKQYRGRAIANSLSPYGKIFAKFIREFSKIKSV